MERASLYEVIGHWLKREYHSAIENLKKYANFTEKLAVQDLMRIISSNNYSDENENLIRTFFLMIDRYPLLLPCWNAQWYKSQLRAEEFKELRVINSSGWFEISINESLEVQCRLSAVATNVFEQRVNPISNQPQKDRYERMVLTLPYWEKTHNLENLDTQLILLESADGIQTILEGNKTAMALYIKCFLRHEIEYSPIDVFVGKLDTKCMWQFE